MGSSSASSAAAVCEHMHDWWYGNLEGGWVSMGVILEKEMYGVPSDICFSMPCNVQDGKWRIVEDLQIDKFS